MDAFIARQPIFGRNMRLFGYELLYRQSEVNCFSGIDDNRATSELLYNAFFVMGLRDLTDGTNAFINFSKDLINSDLPLMLPKENIVIEVLERGNVTEATVSACKKLKEMGYKLALDDFVFSEDNLPLIQLADIIKVEFSVMPEKEQRTLIRKYGSKVRFLAEKIETREEYAQAAQMGYSLFQGYFFSKPAIVKSRDVETLNTNLIEIFKELGAPEPSYPHIAGIFERDLGLSYKLLKLANSVYMGATHRLKSIQHALTFIGLKELRQWISLMMIKEMQNVENAELIKQSLIRGKFMELLAERLNPDADKSEAYFTGIFSSIDVLLNRDMDQILQGLPISENVKDALSGSDNNQRHLLDFVTSWEMGSLEKASEQVPMPGQFLDQYVEALKWANSLNY